ncbi:MAG: hypothetical protein IT297_08260 [Anaerolineae bacterium]|nr:hypothetical protein [Anaerolineae bacterium]
METSNPSGLPESRRQCEAAGQRGEVHSTSPFWAKRARRDPPDRKGAGFAR